MVKKTIPQRIFHVFNVLFMIALCAVILFPYLNVLAISLNDSSKAVPSGLMLFPRAFTLRNYATMLSKEIIWRAALITVGRVIIGTVYAVVVTFCATYGLTRKGLPFRKTLVMFFFIPTYISGGLIPLYILYSGLGLLNNPLVYVLPIGFTFFNYILLRSYMQTVPDSLEESAKLDGANDFTIMIRIFYPLCMPVIATIALLTIIHHWNDWTTTMFFFSNNKWNTLSYELQLILNQQTRLNELVQAAIRAGDIPRQSPASMESLKYTQIIICSLPIVMVYPFLQRYFITGMTLGGVKE